MIAQKKQKNILIISTNSHDLHYHEFVKPIEEIVKNCGQTYKTIRLSDIKSSIHNAEIRNSAKIIIAGTSLQDYDYGSYDMKWLVDYENPVLAICAGMQLICKLYDCSIKNAKEIGLKEIIFKKQFLGSEGKVMAYCLHNHIVADNAKLKQSFDIYASTKYPQALKHKHKSIYCVLFHPEVRNRLIVEKFIIQE